MSPLKNRVAGGICALSLAVAGCSSADMSEQLDIEHRQYEAIPEPSSPFFIIDGCKPTDTENSLELVQAIQRLENIEAHNTVGARYFEIGHMEECVAIDLANAVIESTLSESLTTETSFVSTLYPEDNTGLGEDLLVISSYRTLDFSPTHQIAIDTALRYYFEDQYSPDLHNELAPFMGQLYEMLDSHVIAYGKSENGINEVEVVKVPLHDLLNAIHKIQLAKYLSGPLEA